MRFCFVFSEDYSLIKEKIKEISTDFFNKHKLVSKRYVYWGDEGLAGDFWQVLMSASLETSADFILVRRAELLKVDIWKKLSDALGRLREDCFVLFCIESAWEKKKPKTPAHVSSQKCFTFSQKKNWYFQVPPLEGSSLFAYIKQGIHKRSLKAERDIMDILVNTLAPIAGSIDNSLDQLALAVSSSKTIQVSDLSHLSTAVPEVLFYEYVNLLETGKTEIIWKKMLLSQNVEEIFFPLLATLTREARQLWQILSKDSALNLPSYRIQAKQRIAQRLGKRGIAVLFSLLSDADWSVKSGQKQVTQAMEELLFRLTLLYRVK